MAFKIYRYEENAIWVFHTYEKRRKSNNLIEEIMQNIIKNCMVK